MKQTVKATLLLLILSTGNLYAKLQGQAKIDSLLKELPKQKEDTNKVNLLGDLSFGYRTINPDEGIKYGQQGLELATKLEWKKGMAHNYNTLGTDYQNKSDYPKALEYFFTSLKMYEEIGWKKGIASVTGNIGNIYNSQSDYPKALECYFKSLKLNEEIGNKQGVASTLGNIGSIYRKLKDYPKALEYDFKALKLNEELGNKAGIATNTSNIGANYYFQKDNPKALEYYFKGLKLAEEIGEKGIIVTNTGNIGSIYIDQKNYVMAVEYMQRALKMSEELGSKSSIAINLVNIGGVYIAIIKDSAAKTERVKGEPEFSVNKYQPTVSIPTGKAALLAGAIGYEQRALVICKELNNLDLMQKCYDHLTEAYKLKGDYKQAMVYGDSSKIINDSVFSQSNREQIAKLESKRKEYADSLKAADAKRAADVKAEHRRNYELIGAGVIVLLLGVTLIVTRNNKLLSEERKKSDNLLLNILPEEVAAQLKSTGEAEAKQFDDVTVLFTDFVNFTEAGDRMKPKALVDELHTCFKAFDEITAKHNIEKIKTIGDAYLAVCGLPTADPKHAENVVRAAIEISAFMQDRMAKLGERTFAIRIGIHSGSVVAGIVGVKKFAYDIWGDTVNTAARMEQNSKAGKINISQTTYELVKDKIGCEYRGEIEAKGKGQLKMYYVG